MEDSIDIVTATTSSLPIPDYRPDAKTRRYDRQLRLWASAGQKSLEQARILLIGCDATGCQALKNLVLPGVAHFTIISSLPTTSQDVATNFFLHPDSIGHNIAEEAVKYLKELNPSVEGHARVEDPSELLMSDPEFFTSFTLIIASNIEPSLELRLADLLWETSATVGGSDIPLIAIRNSGFIGRVEIQLREHCVIDTHPDTTHTLRIDRPFSALENYARSLNLDEMDSMEHSHIPWVVLLVRAGSIWKEEHNGGLPSTSEEKDEFKKMLSSWRIKGDEENFDEALAQAYRVWMSSEVPYELQQLLTADNVRNVSENSKNLHILLHALSIFLTSAPHLPPISPTLPDMHSSTTSYIALQNLYRAQASADLQKYKHILAGVLAKIGLDSEIISQEEIEGFVKNSGGVEIIQGSKLRDSKEVSGLLKEVIESEFTDENTPSLPLSMHLSFLASERFYSTHTRWPGSSINESVSSDASLVGEQMMSLIKTIFPKYQAPSDEIVESIAEIVRGGFSTLPTTAAFLGGIVAQEAIKLVTAQYTPLDNTVIIDLVKSTIEKFKF